MKKIWILSFAIEWEKGVFYNLSPDYVKMLESIGSLPVIIPYDSQHIEYYINELDGFVIPWGQDICPDYYFEEPNGARDFCYIQDKSSFRLIEWVIRAKKPLLWICRGMQLINVFLWGSLHQHLENHDIHDQYEKRYETVHSIILLENSFLHKTFQSENLSVNSIHHQAVKTLWHKLKVSAYDGEVIEAIEHEELPIYWTQWHPEKILSHKNIFTTLFL